MKLLVGRSVMAVERRGKWILIDHGDPWLVVHLGMSGQLGVADARIKRAKHTHIVFALNDGQRELRFRDPRRFGRVIYYESRAEVDNLLAKTQLGPEPEHLSPVDWRERLSRTTRSLKAVLLDQTVIAGIGNIYSDEALHAAGLHPSLRACDISPRQADSLRLAICRTLERATRNGGTDLGDDVYVGGCGKGSKFQQMLRVYGRKGEPCKRCKETIQSERLAGRSTHFCPACQSSAGSR
jgi:formamidopyrimidine-DNA glycosylase